MGAQKWFKFYGQEYLSDPKIERLSPTERSCWITLLCMASLTEGKIRFLTVESLLIRSGIHFDPYHPEAWEACLGILRKFQDLEMIECQENGDITLLNWEKRQETNLTDAERAKSYRDRKRERHEIVTDTMTNVTQEKSRVEKSRVEKSRVEKSRVDTTKEDGKKPFGDLKNVKLTDEELSKLVTRYGRSAIHQLVGELSTYMSSKGVSYKDHYATILNWAKRKGVVEVTNQPKPNSGVEEKLTTEQIAANQKRIDAVKVGLVSRFKMK